MEINVVFAPTLDTPDHIALAEELGYERAWVYDVPLAWADTGITLTLAAQRTSRIRLGISVLTPHLRHLAMNAALVAHIATLAPGRFDAGVGTGFTSAAFVGLRPAKWAAVEQYVTDLRTLLTGGDVEVEGATIGLMHGRRTGITLPLDVPFFVAAQGPLGMACARRLGAGVIHSGIGEPDVKPCMISFYGTVLDDGEAYDSARVLDAAGPGAALALHAGPYGPLVGMAELAGFLATVKGVDERRRQREILRGHLIEPNEFDKQFLTGEVVRRSTLTGTPVEVAAELRRLEGLGVTGFMYQPAGEDIPRELRAFRRAAELRHDLPSPVGASHPA